MTKTISLTVEELNMLYIVKGGSRIETIDNIFDMLPTSTMRTSRRSPSRLS